MNSKLKRIYDLNRMYSALRDELMDNLSDDDLGFEIDGTNESLGKLCRDLGNTQHIYVESFKTFATDFTYQNDDPTLLKRVDALKAWYKKLDGDLKTALEAISDEDVENRMVKREETFEIPPQLQLDILREALLIFYGKVSVYLKVMDKNMSEQWQHWIG